MFIPASVINIGRVAFYHTGLKDVCYEGTEEQWKAIRLGTNNEALTQANIHYHSPMPEVPATPAAPTQTKPMTFTDVAANSPFRDTIAWAVERGIALPNPVPGDVCTRSSAVSFLWKLAGSPEAPAASFRDAGFGIQYAQAVNWAVETGVTSGTTDTAFSPNQTCTRGQITTFLYRAMNH